MSLSSLEDRVANKMLRCARSEMSVFNELYHCSLINLYIVVVRILLLAYITFHHRSFLSFSLCLTGDCVRQIGLQFSFYSFSRTISRNWLIQLRGLSQCLTLIIGLKPHIGSFIVRNNGR